MHKCAVHNYISENSLGGCPEMTLTFRMREITQSKEWYGKDNLIRLFSQLFLLFSQVILKPSNKNMLLKLLSLTKFP